MSAAAGLPRLAVTLGDPAGIGPEIAVRAAAEAAVRAVCVPVLIGRRRHAQRAAALLGLPLPELDEPADDDGQDPPDATACAAGGRAAVAAIAHALAGIRAGRYAALVTAPINKAALHAAGVPHPGHTELLAEACGLAPDAVVMGMFGPGLAVALMTCHTAYASVPAQLTPARVAQAARLLDAALRARLGRAPRLALLGLNPHAGEGGLFGDEEQRILAPAARALRDDGLDLSDPLPPDTAFTPAARARYDGHLCCTHDQGLIPFKALCFDQGVNVTLGLGPGLLRTSPDHGTAFDIAWRGIADHRAMVAALLEAARLVRP